MSITDTPIVTSNTLIRSLNARDLILIEELVFLSKQCAKRSPSGARYCTPSLAYLAQKARINIYSVSRHLSKLVRLGIVKRVHRRTIAGKRQTNLYVVTDLRAMRYAKVVREATCIINNHNRTKTSCSIDQLDTHHLHNAHQHVQEHPTQTNEKSNNFKQLHTRHLRMNHTFCEKTHTGVEETPAHTNTSATTHLRTPKQTHTTCAPTHPQHEEKLSNFEHFRYPHLRPSHLRKSANIASLLRKEKLAREGGQSPSPRAQSIAVENGRTVRTEHGRSGGTPSVPASPNRLGGCGEYLLHPERDTSFYQAGMLQRLVLEARERYRRQAPFPQSPKRECG